MQKADFTFKGWIGFVGAECGCTNREAQLSPLLLNKKFVSKSYYSVTVQKFPFLHLLQFLFLSVAWLCPLCFRKQPDLWLSICGPAVRT